MNDPHDAPFALPAPARAFRVQDTTISQFGSRGSPILLVHGWCCHQGFWARLIRELRDDRILLTYDLAGHGSRRSARSVTLDSLTEELRHISRALSLQYGTLHFLGHSMGAQLLVSAGCSLPAASSPILLDEFTGANESPGDEELTQVSSALLHDWRGAFREIGHANLFNDHCDPQVRTQILDEMVSSADPDVAVPLGLESLRNETTAFLISGGRPYVLVNSAYRPTDSKNLTLCDEVERLAIVPSTDHFPQISLPDQVAALILQHTA